jgi:hypothetical protein
LGFIGWATFDVFFIVSIPVHLASWRFNNSVMVLQIGRRLFRLRMETGDREGAVEERRVRIRYFIQIHFSIKHVCMFYRIWRSGDLGVWSISTFDKITMRSLHACW